MTFNKYMQLKLLEDSVGLLEDIFIEGIGNLKAKTDTGNESYNVINGTNIDILNGKVAFKCNNVHVELPYKETIDIHTGNGNYDKRPVISCNCKINGKTYYDILFSISDRSENKYKVLLGQSFIKQMGGIVDITKKD